MAYYFYYWNLQFLKKNAIIIKTKVPLPHAYVTMANFGYPVLAMETSEIIVIKNNKIVGALNALDVTKTEIVCANVL